MTVKELREALAGLPEEMAVFLDDAEFGYYPAKNLLVISVVAEPFLGSGCYNESNDPEAPGAQRVAVITERAIA